MDSQLADAFLRRIRFQELQNDRLVILSAEDALSKGWFEENYLALLKEMLHNEGRPSDISIVISPPPTPKASRKNVHLSPEFTFDLFVSGRCNEFPCHAARSFLSGSSTFNPLVITGPIGSGKTHLAQALAQELLKRGSSHNVICVTGEEFMNDFIRNLHTQSGSMNHFREHYRSCDALIIDDIQALSGKKEGTTTELGNIVDKLISRGVPMVFTSSRPIKNLKDFDERLSARLDGGLNVELKYPAFETRMAILIALMQKEGLSIDDKILKIVAETLEGDVRQLKSMLFKITAYADLKKSHVTMKIAREFLADKIQIDVPHDLSIGDIQRAVAKFYGVTLANIKSESKLGAYTHPRQVAMYLASKHTKNSSTEIGQLFGKSHSTVLRSVQKIEGSLPKSTDLRKQVDKILIDLTGGK